MAEELQEHINKETREDVNRLFQHAEIANKEMGEIKVTLMEHRGILDALKSEVHSVNAKQWWIISAILASGIALLFAR